MAVPMVLKTAVKSPLLRKFNGPSFDHPAIIALRPMLTRILSTYGLTPESPRFQISRALRDFVARIMIHPHTPLHPVGYTANLTVLPTDAPTWSAFLTAMWGPSAGTRVADENAWWGQFGLDGIKFITLLFGTLDRTNGTFANDGMYVEYGPGKWRWRSIATTKSTQCTYQHVVLAHFLAAFGIPGTLISTIGHDGHLAYVVDDGVGNDLGWIYTEATFNESYALPGSTVPLGPAALYRYSLNGEHGKLVPLKTSGPTHDPEPYIKAIPGTDTTYFQGNPGHPKGMYMMGSILSMNYIDQPSSKHISHATQLTSVGLNDGSYYSQIFGSTRYTKTTVEGAFPDLGVCITRFEVDTDVVSITLESTWTGPGPQFYERSVNGGAWERMVNPGDSVAIGIGTVEYRVTDALGFKGSRALITA